MDLIYSDAAYLPTKGQRPNAPSTIFAYEQCSNSNHSTGVRRVRCTRESFVLCNETYSTHSTKREWSGDFERSIVLSILSFCFDELTVQFCVCLYLFCDFTSWRCTVYFQSSRLFTVSYLVHNNIIFVCYVQLITAL